MHQKKTYTKPTIESEEFLPNEYITSCWDITCHRSDCSLSGKFEADSLESLCKDKGIHTDTDHFYLTTSEENEPFATENTDYTFYHKGTEPGGYCHPIEHVALNERVNASF